MTDYVFKYTDQSVGSFVVKPYTANGPAAPAAIALYNNPSTGLHAISANTPFVVVGKGVVDYGQIVQNNIIYLAENFCNKSRPAYPLKGMLWYKNATYTDPLHATDPINPGLYVWSGTGWNAVLINGQIVGNLDVTGNRIVNVGNAINDTDALNTASANIKYLQLTGGTITGNLIIGSGGTLRIATDPIVLSDVTNKQYVDLAALTLQNEIDDVNTNLQTSIDDVASQLSLAYPKTGGTISGNVTVVGDLTLTAGSSLVIPSGAGTVDFGDRRLGSVGTPTLARDAAHKEYVDTAIDTAISGIVIPPGSTSDGVVSAGELDGATGVLTLTRTQGLAPVIIAGTFATKDHTHSYTAQNIAYTPSENQRQSDMYLSPVQIVDVRGAIQDLDRRVASSSTFPVRTVVKQTVGGNTTFTFPSLYEYIVCSNTLSVYLNGIKQYADIRPAAGVIIDSAGIYSVVNVPAATYTQDIIIDSTTHTLSLTVGATTTYANLLTAINNELNTNTVPAVVIVDQDDSSVVFTFVTDLTGSGHTITLAATPTDLFGIIPTASLSDLELEQTLSYAEVGTPLDGSHIIQFHTAPVVDSMIEIVIDRSLT